MCASRITLRRTFWKSVSSVLSLPAATFMSVPTVSVSRTCPRVRTMTPSLVTLASLATLGTRSRSCSSTLRFGAPRASSRR